MSSKTSLTICGWMCAVSSLGGEAPSSKVLEQSFEQGAAADIFVDGRKSNALEMVNVKATNSASTTVPTT